MRPISADQEKAKRKQEGSIDANSLHPFESLPQPTLIRDLESMSIPTMKTAKKKLSLHAIIKNNRRQCLVPFVRHQKQRWEFNKGDFERIMFHALSKGGDLVSSKSMTGASGEAC